MKPSLRWNLHFLAKLPDFYLGEPRCQPNGCMRKIKEVLRLKFEAKLSHEKIAAATGMSKGAVSNAVQRAVEQGLGWPLPAELDEAGLEALMYRKPAPPARYAQPDYAVIHQELKRKGGSRPCVRLRVARGRSGLRVRMSASRPASSSSAGSGQPKPSLRLAARVRHSALRHPGRRGDLLVTEFRLKFEAQNLFDLAHGTPFGWHRGSPR